MNDDAFARIQKLIDNMQPAIELRRAVDQAMEPYARSIAGLAKNAAFVSATSSVQEAARKLSMTASTMPDLSRLANPISLDLSNLIAAAGRASEWRQSLDRSAAVLAELLAAEDEVQVELLKLLAPRGWVLSPTMRGIDVRELLDVAREQGVEAAEAHLLAAYTPEACSAALTACMEHAAFEPWREPLRQALAAHARGEHFLSTPVWIMALEGIAGERLSVSRLFSALQSGKSRKALRHQLAVEGSTTLRDGFVNAIHYVGQSRRTPPDSGELRRHTTMHGADPDYGTPANSVRGIVLLEALHHLLVESQQASATA